jgi:competence protein ComEA
MLRLAVSMATLGFVLAAGASASSAAQPAPQTKAVPRAATKPTTGAIVNINTASASEMTTLPGIGAKTAARIVEYRQKNGQFKKVEELMNVRGIGEKNFLKLKPRLAVGPAKADHEPQK